MPILRIAKHSLNTAFTIFFIFNAVVIQSFVSSKVNAQEVFDESIIDEEIDETAMDQTHSIFYERTNGSGLTIEQIGWDYRLSSEKIRLTFSGGYDGYKIHYDSSNIFANTESIVEENRKWLEGGLDYRLGTNLQLLLSTSLFDGYNHYRSVWLAEYFRQQQFIFNTVAPGSYSEPDPGGFGVGAGLRWDYQPNVGRMEWAFGYTDEEIAPGFELSGGLVDAGRSTLYSRFHRFRLEQVLHPRVRSQFSVNVIDTIDREIRFQYAAALNIALGEDWVLGLHGGYTREKPQFQAHFANASIEYEFRDSWFVFLQGRYYRDNGEIETNGFTTGAPGLNNEQLGAGIRWASPSWSAKIAYSVQSLNYETIGVGSLFFADLYRSRNLQSVQVAFGYQY